MQWYFKHMNNKYYLKFLGPIENKNYQAYNSNIQVTKFHCTALQSALATGVFLRFRKDSFVKNKATISDTHSSKQTTK